MKSIEKHILTYSLSTTAILIAFFFVMKAFGLIQTIELRSLNAIFMFGGSYLAIKNFKEGNFKYTFNYLSGIAVGFFVALLTSVAFAGFVGLYLYMDSNLLAQIVANQPQGRYLNEISIAMVIFIEAMASGFLFSYASMQFLKQDEKVSNLQTAEA